METRIYLARELRFAHPNEQPQSHNEHTHTHLALSFIPLCDIEFSMCDYCHQAPVIVSTTLSLWRAEPCASLQSFQRQIDIIIVFNMVRVFCAFVFLFFSVCVFLVIRSKLLVSLHFHRHISFASYGNFLRLRQRMNEMR